MPKQIRKRASARILMLVGLQAICVVLFQNCGAFVSDLPTGELTAASASIGGGSGLSNINYQAAISDRVYTQNLMTDLFGPTAVTTDSRKIAVDRVNFGAPCSLYEQYNVPGATSGSFVVNDALSACSYDPSPATLGATNFPQATVTRQAAMVKTCTDMVVNTTTLGYLLSRISGSNTIPQMNTANLQILFGLFYRGKPAADPDLLQSLLELADPTVTTVANWQGPAYLVCASSHWQEL